MILLNLMLTFICLILIGACFALVVINKNLIKLLRKSTRLVDDVLEQDKAIIKTNFEYERNFYRLVKEKNAATKERDAIGKIAEVMLTSKDEEIRHLLQLVKEKKLKVKHQ